MDTVTHCPKCESENVIFSKKRRVHFCEDCGYVLNDTKCAGPMNIFLSYGHDKNVDLVLKIKNDLMERGHNVWFDKSNIKSGYNWRRVITDGIIKSNRVLSFLSKHSTRDPGVCLDEIAIAIGAKGGNIQTILVESEMEVQAPPSISYIQWLDMHDWRDRKAADELSWESWYQKKFNEILQVIESDESRSFAGEIELLYRSLKPISNESRISQLLNKPFVGRKWVINAIEKWRRDSERSSRLFLITGNPGTGKSILAANMAHFGRDRVIAAQFCEWDKDDHRNAQRVIRSLAFQIAARLPDYRKYLLTLPEIKNIEAKNPAELFDYILANPLQNVIDGGRDRYLIIIDALDEASESGFNPLAEMLSKNVQRLPDWIGLVVTSRPEKEITVPLQGMEPFTLDTEAADNLNDIREYLEIELSSYLCDYPNPHKIINELLERSEGLFLYAEHVCREIQIRRLTINNINEFPKGLGQTFLEFFTRRFPISPNLPKENHGTLSYYEKYCRPFLEIVTAAQKPLHPDFLVKVLNIDRYELSSIIDTFGSFVNITNESLRLNHQSITDWLCDRAKSGSYWVDQVQGHKHLSSAGMKECLGNFNGMEPYFMEHLPIHLAKAGDWEKLIILIKSRDLDLIDRWTSRGEPYVGLICLQGIVSYLLNQNKEISFAAGLLTQIAKIHIVMGNYIEAEKCVKKSISISKNLRISAIAFHELGALYRYKGDLFSAERHYKTALNLCTKKGKIIEDEAAANLISLASVKLLQYDYQAVFDIAEEALEKAKKAGDVYRTIAANRILATAYKDNLEYDNAKKHIDMASILSKFNQLPLESIATDHLYAWLLYSRSILDGDSKLDTAIDLFKSTIDKAIKYSYRPYKLSASIGLIWCYLAEYKDEPANDTLIILEQNVTSASSYDLIIEASIGRAAVMHQQNNPEEAASKYNTTIKLCQKYNQSVREADCWQGLGSIWWHSDRKKDAECCWHKSDIISNLCSPAKNKLILKSIEKSRSDPKATPL